MTPLPQPWIHNHADVEVVVPFLSRQLGTCQATLPAQFPLPLLHTTNRSFLVHCTPRFIQWDMGGTILEVALGGGARRRRVGRGAGGGGNAWGKAGGD